MDLMQTIYERAQAAPQRVAFSEGHDPTMMSAAAQAAQLGIAVPVLVGDARELRTLAAERGIDPAVFEYADVSDEAANARLAASYLALPVCQLKEKGVLKRCGRALERSMLMLATGQVDVAFAGIVATTGEVVAAGQALVGLAPGIGTVSSCGIFDIPGYQGSEGPLLGFGDSAVCQNPDAGKLASIAISCCDTVRALTGWHPRCALLSYSTDGSAAGELVQKVVAARDIARDLRPDLDIDGEFQLDAAINPQVAQRKVKRPSAVAGRANIVIWPDLNVGNVGVKLVQQLAGANAYGPMLQGFAKIVCDCSRGAPVSEIVGNIAMSCVRAQALGV